MRKVQIDRGGDMSEELWYYEKDGEQHGPVSRAELQALIEIGEISRENLAWKPGERDWSETGTYEVLIPSFQTPPPVKPDKKAAPPPPPPATPEPVAAHVGPTAEMNAAGSVQASATQPQPTVAPPPPPPSPSPGTGSFPPPKAHPGTGTYPVADPSNHPPPGPGSYPAAGAASHPAPGTGSHPAPGTGSYPAPGTGSHPAPGTGSYPAPGTGSYPVPGTGHYPVPGAGNPALPGTGSYPAPQHPPHRQPTGGYPGRGSSGEPPAEAGRTFAERYDEFIELAKKSKSVLTKFNQTIAWLRGNIWRQWAAILIAIITPSASVYLIQMKGQVHTSQQTMHGTVVPAGYTGPVGQIKVDAYPWAELTGLSRDGKNLDVPGPTQTPLVLLVAPGSYRVELGSHDCTVEVAAETSGTCKKVVRSIDAAAYYQEVGW